MRMIMISMVIIRKIIIVFVYLIKINVYKKHTYNVRLELQVTYVNN